MGNTENLENIENVENLEAMPADGGEPEDTEEVIARREEALKKVKEYYDLIFSGDYNVRILGPDKKLAVEPLTVNPDDEAKLITKFEIKALQNSGNISTLSWNSSGNVANFNLEAVKWDRIGVSCCKTGHEMTPYFMYSYSEHILDSADTHGNKNFKAVMVKADYHVIVPAYSEVTLNVTMNIHVLKRGGETSSTWLGAIISDKDTWTTINDDNDKNNKWADNNGVIKSSYETDCTLASDDSKKVNLRLSLNDYNCGTQKNTSNKARLWTFTLYIMGNIEKASTINHRLLIFDRFEDKFSARITGASEITYDPNGGVMTGGTKQKIYYVSGHGVEDTLYTAKRTGYTLAGWKDDVTGLLYPAGGTYMEKRGMKLTAQWVPDKVDCRVEHYQQGVDGNYPGAPTEYDVLKTPAGESIMPNRKNYEGFITPDSIVVKPDGEGTTVAKFYYERKKYRLVFCANGGMFGFRDGEDCDYIETEVSYGEALQYPNLKLRQNYCFEGWTENLTTMPARDVTIRVVWKEND